MPYFNQRKKEEEKKKKKEFLKEMEIKELKEQLAKDKFLKPIINAEKLLEKLVKENGEFEDYLSKLIGTVGLYPVGRHLILDGKRHKHYDDRPILSLMKHWTETGNIVISLSYSEPDVLAGAHHKIIQKMQTEEGIIDFLINKFGI